MVMVRNREGYNNNVRKRLCSHMIGLGVRSFCRGDCMADFLTKGQLGRLVTF